MIRAHLKVWLTAAAAAAVVLALWGASAAASSGTGASSGPSAGSGQPYQVRWASLRQDGQDLLWRVELAQPWDASRLVRGGRAVCLLIERVASGDVWGEACVLGPARRSREARLEYMAVSGTKTGRASVFSADVTRPNQDDLTASFLPSAVGLRYGTIRWQTASAVSSSACQSGGACSTLYPAKPTLLRLHKPIPAGCVASGPSVVSHGPSNKREIALTFDDGPWGDPPTIDFVRMLAREHVPATFFEIGDQISTYDPTGSVERQMLANGDMIGDHTWTHPMMTTLSPAAQRSELLKTVDAIRHATGGFTPCLWRPPYGDIDPSLISLARSLGLLTIMWDVDPSDWKLPGVGAIYSNVVDNAHNGAIVIQHFGGGPRYETLAAVPEEINTLRARGYRFVTVAQLLGLKTVYR